MTLLDNRFQLAQELNRGGFGIVHVATDFATRRTVAVKQLLRLGPAELELFRREVRYLDRAKSNPNVVQLLWHNLLHNPPYIVMEYCAGGSLRSRVGKLDWQNVCNIVAAAANALKTVHDAGGHHRDVKPDNLLLAGPNEKGHWLVKLGDFGLARVPSSRATSLMTRNACGTEGYMAPELLLGASFTSTCDIYSLGVTAVELLTGIRDPRARLPVAVPGTVQDLFRRMASISPSSRPSATLIGAEIAQVFAGLERTSKPAEATPVTPKSSGWGWLALGAAAFLGGIGLLAANNNGGRNWDRKAQRYRDSKGRFTS